MNPSGKLKGPASGLPAQRALFSGSPKHASAAPTEAIRNRRAPWGRRYIGILVGIFVFQSFFLYRLSSIQEPEEVPRKMEELRPKFVLFGDSITQHSFREGGWGAALQNEYARKVDVVLRGYSGYNSRWALFLLDKVFPKSSATPPSLVTIFFGANDASLPDRNSQRQHVPIEEYKQNLERIVAHIRSVSVSTKIVLICPPPIDEKARLEYAREMYGDKAVSEPERLNAVTGRYAAACSEVAFSLSVPSIDLWTAIQEKPGWQDHLSDGLHLSPKGNAVVFQELIRIITSHSQWSLVQTMMDWDFPEHVHITRERPGIAFAKYVKDHDEAGSQKRKKQQQLLP